MSLLGRIAKALQPVPNRGTSWWGVIREPFAGAWQKNIECETQQNILAFSAVYACISLIAGDIAKLRMRLMELTASGVWQEVTQSPFLPVLRKPNRYQTRIQFLHQWVTLLLLYGNTYIYKARNDLRGMVTEMYVLDSRLVTPLVADDGSVWYELRSDRLIGVGSEGDRVVVPASEIIHDRMMCPWHPLVGVSPIYACGASATQGIRIQNNSEKFFANMSRPSGMLTAPGAISDETAKRMKDMFEQNFSGMNIGRLLVAGDGVKYEGFTIPAQDAQLIEQLKWTVEDVARCFHVPLYKLGGAMPTFTNVGALNTDYYTQTLQERLESIEALLDEGLGVLNAPDRMLGVDLDVTNLLRMDPKARAETNEIRLRSGELAPDEARQGENLPPVTGGDTPYLQQQNFSLAALAKRDAQPDPFATEKPAAPALPAPPDDEGAAKFMRALLKGYEAEVRIG